MTETAAQLLTIFESLPPQEKHELLTEMLRRSGELPEAFLIADDYLSFADELFQTLDAEESDASESGANEVWLVDLGMAAKVRPCLVLNVPADNPNDRVLTTLIPHTTSTRASRFEVRLEVSFLKSGAFDAQNLITIPTVKLIRRLGGLTNDQMAAVEFAIKQWLKLE